MSESIKIAAVQMDVTLGNTEENLKRIASSIRTTAVEGARLAVFPECSATGYCFDNLEEALPYGESVPGPSTEQIAAVCRETDSYVIFGLLETEGKSLFNACVLVGREGLLGSYRKIHLPFLGVDRFATPGDRPFDVHSAGKLRIGMNICYDIAFPESSRVMALEGADLIALPTNFPEGAECLAEHIVNARAMENKVYYVCANRVGTERGFKFIGHSKICDTVGTVLAEASNQDETILYAEIDTQEAREKLVVRVPGKHQIDRFADRRPEMYSRITEDA